MIYVNIFCYTRITEENRQPKILKGKEMISSNVKFTNDKKISYEQRLFIKTSLRQIGINPKNNGLLVFQQAIIYAYYNDMVIINLEEIYRFLSSKHKNKAPKTIETILRYAFYNINVKKLSSNYEKIFGLEFSMECFSIKTLIEDFIDILQTI